MHGYGPGSYGESFADVYDEWYGDVSDVDATVADIVSLAGGGRTLELGVGTGRLARPLAAAGVDIVGLDASTAMLSRLSTNGAGASVPVALADMAHPPFRDGAFSVVFAAFNTFFNLTDATAQRHCMGRVAGLLQPRGCFVVEGFVPPAEGMPDGGVSVRDITIDGAVLTMSRHDPLTQTIRGQHVQFRADDGVHMRPWMLRYLTPAQLDDLAVAAGFVRESRHAGWSGEPFVDGTSVSHVSVYRTEVV